MATTTTTLGLTKPDYTETADIAVINANMDAIDTAIGGVRSAITSNWPYSNANTIDGRISTLENSVNDTSIVDIAVNYGYSENVTLHKRKLRDHVLFVYGSFTPATSGYSAGEAWISQVAPASLVIGSFRSAAGKVGVISNNVTNPNLIFSENFSALAGKLLVVQALVFT